MHGFLQALRPRQHLPAHRRLLHAVRAAAARGRAAGRVLLSIGLGRRPSLGVAVPGVLGRRTALALRADLHRHGLGRGVLPPAFAAGPTPRRRDRHAVLVLIAVGGVLYTLGGVVYGFKRPDPWPRWFGFHEVFHSLHDPGVRQPLRRRLAGDVLPALTWPRARAIAATGSAARPVRPASSDMSEQNRSSPLTYARRRRRLRRRRDRHRPEHQARPGRHRHRCRLVASVVQHAWSDRLRAAGWNAPHGRVTDARDGGPRLWQRLAVGALAVTLRRRRLPHRLQPADRRPPRTTPSSPAPHPPRPLTRRLPASSGVVRLATRRSRRPHRRRVYPGVERARSSAGGR